ncbi:hypothetical protein ACFQ48_17765 [Hymenobacter caeli]|uniref:Uncharacterized protein n=1 Tax=Hymenobacter caeli TaxID=2735894 RepID=A0ABX2FUD9_9BACT|nr:hypothetical protein [Hymenobacter caeli]NRT20802.1 hypothetical protein [Hymenobacter caeli]
MIIVENPDGFGRTILAEGCDADFLEKLPAHLAFSKGLLLAHGLEVNGTLEQLAEIEKLIAAHREAAGWHTRDFFQGLVAYCGELLRSRIAGSWGMEESGPCHDYPKSRYFPVIIGPKNQTYDFSADIESELSYLLEPGLNWDKMDGLYYAMKYRFRRPGLPPGKSDELPLPF